MLEIFAANAPWAIAAGGLVVGFAFGWIVARTNFCAMGAISDFVTFGDYRRFRAWICASAIALAGAQVLDAYGLTSLKNSMYLSSKQFDWLGSIAGGLMFGAGMAFAGGCASRNLVRAGGGDLRSLVVLVVMGIFAYISIGGVFGPIRAALSAGTALNLSRLDSTGLGAIAAFITGIDAFKANVAATAIIAGGALLYCFKDAAFRQSLPHIIAGIGIGLCVVAGWAVTGMAFDEFSSQPASTISLTFVRPTGDTLEWLQRYTAVPLPGFGVTSTLGTLFGAFAAALTGGRFKLATFASTSDTLRNLLGAALMGIGGVMALGCTIGQAVTGVSTLAAGSFLTFAAIVAGGIAGIKKLETALSREI